jgi:hypothetical protein
MTVGRYPTGRHGTMIPMSELFPALTTIYGIGVVVGLIMGDARPAARVGLALAWPLGPIAFVVTVAMLLAATPVAFIGKR